MGRVLRAAAGADWELRGWVVAFIGFRVIRCSLRRLSLRGMFRGFDTAIEREASGKACKGGCPLFPQLGPEKFVACATESFCGNRGSPCTPCHLPTFAVAKSRITCRGAEAGAEHNPSPHESIHPNQPRPRTGGQTTTQPSPTHRPSGHVIKSTPDWRAGDRSPRSVA